MVIEKRREWSLKGTESVAATPWSFLEAGMPMVRDVP